MTTFATALLGEAGPFAPSSYWNSSSSQGHSVHFYEDDSFLIEGLSRFIGAALIAGDSAVVIATREHREALEEHFRRGGLNLAPAISQGRYLCLDAAETLSHFMVDGQPDASRFANVVGSVIPRLASAAQGRNRRVAAFGEMVSLLWADGHSEAAIRLEQLWNRLAETQSFHLHCAYPLNLFPRPEDGTQVQRICVEHSEVFPTERYTSLETDQERLRAIAFLEQKAQVLENEIVEKKQAEQDAFRLAAIVESSDNAIISKDLNGIVTSWNRAAERIFGYKAEEIVGKSITLLIPPELQDDEPRILARIQAGERIDHFQTVRMTKDGRRIDVSLTISPVKDHNGHIIGAAKIAHDITLQKKIEEAALRLAAIVESSDDAIVSKDLNGVVTSWNKGAERIFGYKAEEIVGQSITLIIPPELHDDEPRILAKIRAGERIEHFETVRVRKNGEYLNVSLTVSPVRDEQGRVVGAAKIARDVTQQKKNEAALHTSERLASVGRLAATVAHEINNPLEAVTNYIYLANLQPDLSEKVRRYLTAADQELSRVAHIAQQTLGFYRDNSLPVKLVISEAIDDVLRVYDRRFKYKDLHVQCDVEPTLTAWTLQGEFKQILSNLIANAIDASKEGGKIVIRARSSDEYRSGRPGVRITIADYGSGISAEDKAQLFTPFFTTKKEVGTGLGLWITKDLLEKKGGHIRLRSRDSKPSGTVIGVYLPLKSPAAIAEQAA